MMLARPRPEGELFRVVGQLQWRLGREQLLVSLLRGSIAGAAGVVAIAVLAWLMDAPAEAWGWALAGLARLAGLGWAITHWPSPLQAARAADRRLELEDRLATAVELSTRGQGRLDGLQKQ